MGTSHKQLSADERAAIHRGRLEGLTPAAIAKTYGASALRRQPRAEA
jgi:hypothetical protein